ncbi:MAG TPA: hypothetical protein DCZ93_04870 [Elusimicrobia bacterium]|nr:hypothetical protein [Elusimicrobiota bacterium]
MRGHRESLALSLFLFIQFCGGCSMKDTDMKSEKIRVAFKYDKPASYYDPANISFAPEYDFLENIYSTLLEYSPEGELVGSLAESFEWVGSEARFRIRPDLRTIDGRRIDAHDVETSLKRLFIVGGNTHGDLKDVVCPDKKLTKLSDNCPGMEVRDSGKTFVFKLKEKKVFLFPMLTSIDFAIIPADSLDRDSLKIKDYRNTSGPYFISKDSPEGGIELSANPAHFHYSKSIPQEVLFVPSGKVDPMESLELFSKNKADFITTIDSIPPDVMIDYAKKHPGEASLHATHALDTFLLIFTAKGLRNFSERERFAIGRTYRELFLKDCLKKPGYEAAEQIFPAFGGGALSEEQLSGIRAKMLAADIGGIKEKSFRAWNVNFTGSLDTIEAEFEKIFPAATLQKIRKIPGRVDYAAEKLAEPDFYLMRTDMGFQEDINLLSYYLGIDFFSLEKAKVKPWLRGYIANPNKNERLLMLRELHFNTLSGAAIIPLAKTPYTALARKPWEFNMSKYHANDPVWRIFQP